MTVLARHASKTIELLLEISDENDITIARFGPVLVMPGQNIRFSARTVDP